MIPIEKKIVDTLLAESTVTDTVAGSGTVEDPYSIYLWDKRQSSKKAMPALFFFVYLGKSETIIPATRGNVRFFFMQDQQASSYAAWKACQTALRDLFNRNISEPLTEINGDEGSPEDSIKVMHLLNVSDDYEYEIGELMAGILDFEFVLHDNDDVYTTNATWV